MAMRMRWRIALSALVAAGGLTACASSAQTTGSPPPSFGRAATSSSASPVTTTNTARRSVAEQLVNKLLADVQLPPGAQAQPSAPASILADPGATQVSTNLVQAFGWFVVPGTEASVLAFETAHSLPGFSSGGIGHASGPGFTEEDEMFTGTQAAEYGPPIIDVEATADGDSVAVRVNVGVIWRPVRTAAEHVPDTVTGATAVLVSSDPATSVQLDEATARQFAAMLNVLDTQLPAEGSCPPTPTTMITFTIGGQKLVFEAGPCGSVVVTVGGVSQPTLAEYTTSGTSTLAVKLNSLFGIITSPAPSVAGNREAAATSAQTATAPVDSSPPRTSVKQAPGISTPHPVTGTPPQPRPPQHAVASVGSLGNRVLTAATVAQLGLPLPFPNETMNLSTAYSTVLSNNYLSIYTGSSPSDSTQGVVIVRSQTADSFTTPIAHDNTFTENGTGPLTITAVTGVLVSMKDQHGATHTFNVTTGAFS